MGDGCAWVDGQCQERVIITVNPNEPEGAQAWAGHSIDSKTAVWALSGSFITIAILIGIVSIWWNWGAIWTTVRTVAANFRQGLGNARDGVVERGRRLTRRRPRVAENAGAEEVPPDDPGDGGVNEDGGVNTPDIPGSRRGSDASTRALSRTPPPRRRSGSVGSQAASISPAPISSLSTTSTPRRIPSITPLASLDRQPPPLIVPEELDMTPQSTRLALKTSTSSAAPETILADLPDIDEMRRKQDAELMFRNQRLLEELKQEDTERLRRQPTHQAMQKTATPQVSTPLQTPSTPPAKDISTALLAELRQKNLEEGVRREKDKATKGQKGGKRYQEVMVAQKRRVSTIPRVHSMRSPKKTDSKRELMSEKQITQVVDSFLDELMVGRKKKSLSNTRTHVRRQPVERRRCQRRR